MLKSIKRMLAFAGRAFRMSVKNRLRRQFLRRMYLAA
jgi:hypothetical protein